MARHISRLNIESFRGIKGLDIKELGDINILVGENNSGKTTVLEVIKGLSVPLEIGNWLSACRKRDNIFSSIGTYTMLENMFNINEEDKKIRIIADISNREICMEIQGNEEILLMENSEIEDMKNEQRYGKNNIKFTFKDEDELKKQEEIKVMNVQLSLNDGAFPVNIVNEKIFEITKKVRILEKNSKRLFTATYIAPFEHTFNRLYLKEILEQPELYAEMIKIAHVFDKQIIGINAFFENEEQVYKITSASNKKALPLAVYGDGIKKALVLISAIIKSRDGVLLLDELETAIHTSALKQIFNLILDVCKKYNVQLFATTHSSEALDKLLKDGENLDMLKNMKVITLVKKEDKTIARILSGEKALQVRNDYDMELRK